MDIEEDSRYDVSVGGKHDVGFLGIYPDTRLVWIELGVEVPKNGLAVILHREAREPVQVKHTRHYGK
jgi:hypothetical protein